MKTAKVVSVQSNGTWDSPNGLMYKWDISLDNNDSGQAMTKDKEHKTWVIGESVTYTLEPNKNPNYPGKLTRIKEQPQQGVSKDPGVQKLIVAQNSITNAVNHCNGGMNNTPENVLIVAEKFYNWVLSKG